MSRRSPAAYRKPKRWWMNCDRFDVVVCGEMHLSLKADTSPLLEALRRTEINLNKAMREMFVPSKILEGRRP